MGIGDFFNNTILSLNTKDQGFSYRKIISLVVLSLTVYLHIHFANKDNVINFLAYDFGFISVLLGLLNLDRFVSMKFGNNGVPGQTSQSGQTLDPASSQTVDPTGGTQSGS
jgi:hypothetical protein